MKIHVTHATNTDGDWEALYINGRLADGVDQNHSLQVHDVLDAVLGEVAADGNISDYVLDHVEADMEEGMADWMGDRGFPEYLGQIPLEARS